MLNMSENTGSGRWPTRTRSLKVDSKPLHFCSSEYVGDIDIKLLGLTESTLRHHSANNGVYFIRPPHELRFVGSFILKKSSNVVQNSSRLLLLICHLLYICPNYLYKPTFLLYCSNRNIEACIDQ
ncbi:MAG: hypothetical protein ACI9BF_000311 [Candidatus Paceibacteria bacterium]|jgi:hypothetical protein